MGAPSQQQCSRNRRGRAEGKAGRLSALFSVAETFGDDMAVPSVLCTQHLTRIYARIYHKRQSAPNPSLFQCANEWNATSALAHMLHCQQCLNAGPATGRFESLLAGRRL